MTADESLFNRGSRNLFVDQHQLFSAADSFEHHERRGKSRSEKALDVTSEGRWQSSSAVVFRSFSVDSDAVARRVAQHPKISS